MEAKKKGRRKLARIRTVVVRPDVVLPRLQLTLEGKPVKLTAPFLLDPGWSPHKVVVQFEFPCPCCKQGVAGEIVGRL